MRLGAPTALLGPVVTGLVAGHLGANHRGRRGGAALVVALVAVTTLAACTQPAADTATSRPSEPSSTDAPTSSVSPSSASGAPHRGRDRLSIVPSPDGSLLVRGRYPQTASRCRDADTPLLRARYPGALTVRRSGDGTLTLLVRLPFERYLEGVAEVPSSWPMAALEAQAIAARSYALATTGWTGEGTKLDAPICSTTACQVYRGIPVPPEQTFRRWQAAVRRTAGRMLVWNGRPAEAVYFSTSNGRTYGNDEVFGSEPLPYLRPVRERDDHASPTSRWDVRLPLTDLATFLAVGGTWRADTPLRHVEVRGETVRLEGGGRERTVDLRDLRAEVNAWAPCLMPHRYPGPSRLGVPLPLTIPSPWFRVEATDTSLVLHGRGWGHGVGMVQWGAYGKARRGLDSSQILAAYYGGLRPTAFPEPRAIDVQVATGLTSITVLPSGVGAKVDDAPVGSDTIRVAGGPDLRVVVPPP